MSARIYTSHRRQDATRLMVMAPGEENRLTTFEHLGELLHPNDLLVMNDSATIPGSLWTSGDRPFELRLAAFAGHDLHDLREWWAVAFGEGSWRMPTEARGAPPVLHVGERLQFSESLSAHVTEVHPVHRRLVKIKFEGQDFLREIYRAGHAIQYSYHQDELKIWDIQTPLAQVPISVEPPSALLPFSWKRLLSLKTPIAYLTHGAGLSSTGEPSLDEFLPLPEYYEIPERTLRAIEQTHAKGGRVIAVGTTVARALESAFRMNSSSGTTTLRLTEREGAQIVDGLLTGFHEPGTSHFMLEEAFLERDRLEAGFRGAEKLGFIGHEYGDSVLILRTPRSPMKKKVAIMATFN